MPDKKMLTRIVSSKSMKKVLAAYEGARPKGLECSYVVPAAPAASSSDTQAFQGTVDVAKGAIAAQVAGWRGGALVIGAQAASDTWGLVKDWWSSDSKNDLFLNLDYLAPVDFENENKNIPQEEAQRLKQLYNLAYTYQSQKMSRGWLNLGILANYSEGVINDTKYLAVILIGRKLQFALNAISPADYEMQMQHLAIFIDALSMDMPEIFDTHSNDQVYLSLITLVKNIRKAQIDEDLRKANEDICEQIKSSLNSVQLQCAGLMQAFKNSMLFGSTIFTTELLDRYNIPAQAHNAKKVKNFALIEKIFLSPDLDNIISEQDLALLLSDVSKVTIASDASVVKAGKEFLDKQREVARLNHVLSDIQKLINVIGHLGVAYILQDLRTVMDHMQQTYMDSLSLRHEFIKHFLDINTPSLAFKVKQLKYTRKIDIEGLHAEMIRLFALAKNVSAQELNESVESKARELILGIKSQVNSLYGEAASSDDDAIPEKIIKMEEQKKRIEQERIERLEKQAEMLSVEMGELLAEQEESREREEKSNDKVVDLTFNLKMQLTQNQALTRRIHELTAASGLSQSVAKAEEQRWAAMVSDLTKKNNKLLSASQEIQAKPARRAKQRFVRSSSSETPPRRSRLGMSIEQEAIETIKEGADPAKQLSNVAATFSYFLKQYIEQPRPRPFVIWHKHGKDGIKMGEKVNDMWMQRSQAIIDHIQLPLADAFKRGVVNLLALLDDMVASDFITGNFHKHSLKTFIIQFREHLVDVRDEQSAASSLSKADVFKAYFTDKMPDHSSSGMKNYWNSIKKAHNIVDRSMCLDQEPVMPISRS